MLSSAFRKKIAPQIYNEEKAAEKLEPVEYEIEEDNEDSKNSKSVTLYFRPKLSVQTKFFTPNQWSIDRFQIGKHLGRGKYFLFNAGTGMSTWHERDKPNTLWRSKCCQRSRS